jgi:hypothetical protein
MVNEKKHSRSKAWFYPQIEAAQNERARLAESTSMFGRHGSFTSSDRPTRKRTSWFDPIECKMAGCG